MKDQIQTLTKSAMLMFAFISGYNTVTAEQSMAGISCASASTRLDMSPETRNQTCREGNKKCERISINMGCRFTRRWFVDYPVATPHTPYYGPPLYGPELYREFVECECKPI